jgi:mono/diheme cytochrome c family protein
MNKIKTFIALFLVPFICVLGLTAVALAQNQAPAPYTGLKNPNSWTDAAAIKAGKAVYLKSCFSCHGATGADVAQADFSTPEFAASMEAHPDFYFFVVSEGIKDTEMASYKFTVTEPQRWQVLTYIHSLGYVAPSTTPPPPKPGDNTTGSTTGNTTTNTTGPVNPSPGGSGGVTPPPPPPVEVVLPPVLTLKVPAKAEAGQPLHISVNLTQGNETIAEAPVIFFFKVQFFTNAPALATIGQAVTDENGTAEITYTPKTTGFIPVVAQYTPDGDKPIQVTSTVELTAQYPLYESEVGIPYKGFPPDIVLFPKSVWDNRAPGIAPVTVFRIPGGLPFIPFVAYLAVIILVWSLYVNVMYQVFRIVPKDKVKGLDLRLLPMAGMAVLGGAGLLMVLILVTGPYSGHVIMP